MSESNDAICAPHPSARRDRQWRMSEQLRREPAASHSDRKETMEAGSTVMGLGERENATLHPAPKPTRRDSARSEKAVQLLAAICRQTQQSRG
eukprot:5970729-Alexandrium_andersonii.AAC.1